MKWLLAVLALLCWRASAAIMACYLNGHDGTFIYTPQSIVIQFSGSLATSYTAAQLTSAFAVTVNSTGRPLSISQVVVSTDTIGLNFLQTNDLYTEYEPRMGLAFNVTYKKLVDVSGAGVQEGGYDIPAMPCASFTRLTSNPVLLLANRNEGTAGTLALTFSEPVKVCTATTFTKTDITTTGTITLDTDPVGLDGPLSTTWTLSFSGSSDASSLTAQVSNPKVCDYLGNAIIHTAPSIPITSNKPITGYADFLAQESKYYDVDLDGKVDAVLVVTNFPFNHSLVNSTNLVVKVNGALVSNPRYMTEEWQYSNAIFVTFDGVVLNSYNVPPTIEIPYAFPVRINSGSEFAQSYTAPRVRDYAPPVITTARSTVGSKTVVVVLSEPSSSSLSSSSFTWVFVTSNSVASSSSTTSTITFTLTNALQSLDFAVSAPTRVYIKPDLSLRMYGLKGNWATTTWKGENIEDPTRPAECYTSGNASNLVRSVILRFNGNLTNTYTQAQLSVIFFISIASSARPIPIDQVVLDTTTSTITIPLRQFSGDLEAQTGAIFTVLYRNLSDLSGASVKHEGYDLATTLCFATIDRTSPVLLFAIASNQSESATLGLVFSEPVQSCNGATFNRTNLSTTGVVRLTSEPSGLDGSLSSVWVLGCASAFAGSAISINTSNLCDASNNPIVNLSAVAIANATSRPFMAEYSKYYDRDLDGKVDAVLAVSNFPFDNSLANSTNLPVKVNGALVTGAVYVAENSSVDNSVFITFTGVTLSDVTVPPTVVNPDPFPVRYGLSNAVADGNTYPVVRDLAPPVILSATASPGSNQLVVTLSEPHSSPLSYWQFTAVYINSNEIETQSGAVSSITFNHVNAFQLSDFTPTPSRIYLAAGTLLRSGGSTGNIPDAPWISVNFTDTQKPTVLSIEARNDRLYGPYQDTFVITFDEYVTSAVLGSFVPYSYYRNFYASSVDSSTDTVTLSVDFVSCKQARRTCYNTGSDFDLLVGSGAVQDYLGNILDAFDSASASVVDRAFPVLVSAFVEIGSPDIVLTFSESLAPGFDETAFNLTITDGTITGFLLEDDTVTLTLDRDIAASDLTGSSVNNCTGVVDLADNEAICSRQLEVRNACSFVVVENEYPWPGYSLWADFDFESQITPFVTTSEIAAYLVARLEFTYLTNRQIYTPSSPQWTTQPISDGREIVMTDTGFRLYDPVLALGNWSIAIKSIANDAAALQLRFLSNGLPVDPLISCSLTQPENSRVRLLASVDGLLSFSVPVRKCSGAALDASDLGNWNCTGTLTLVTTSDAVPAGFSRLWRCATSVNDSSLVVPVAYAICDQYGTAVSLFFNGRGFGAPTASQPYTALDANSSPGLFETFWFVDPSTRNISRILTRGRSIFNDSLMTSGDTFGYSFDQWMAYSSPNGFNVSNDTVVALNVSRSAAAGSRFGTEAATYRIYSVGQFPLSYLYNCTKVDLWYSSSSVWGLQCSVNGHATPPTSFVSRLTCVNSSTSALIPITNVSFPSSGRINVEFQIGTMLDDATCFSSVPTQVAIEDTSQAPLIDPSTSQITSAYLTSFDSSSVPDSLVIVLSEPAAIVPFSVIQRAIDSQQISLTCDSQSASILRPTTTSAGRIVLRVQNCTSVYSTRRPPSEAVLDWPASISYVNGRVVDAFASDVVVTMNERVLSVVCSNSAIFILFDQTVSVSLSDNNFTSTCTAGGLTLRGALNRMVIVDVQVPGTCSFSFHLASGSRVYLNGSWCVADACAMGAVVSAVSVSDSHISVDFEGTVCNETLLAAGLFSLFTDEGERVALTTTSSNGSRVVLAYERRANSTGATLAHELIGPFASVRVSGVLYPLSDSFVCRRNIFDSTRYFVSIQITGQWDLDAGYSITPTVCTVRSATRIGNASLLELVLPSGDEDNLISCTILVNYTSIYTLTKNFTAIALSRCTLSEQVSDPSNLFTDFPVWIAFLVLLVYVFPILYLAIIAIGQYLSSSK